jgi:lipoprotein-anchoring transpeptidase ErfK/SrfK
VTAVPAVPSPLRRARPCPWRALALAVVLVVAAAACTGERPRLADETSTTTVQEESSAQPEPPSAEVAEANEPTIEVFATEDADTPDRELAAGEDTSVEDIPLVFLVKAREDGGERIEVYLPTEPSGSSGWVDAEAVTLNAVPYKVEVALGEHQLRVLRDDEVLLDEPVGVGCEDRVTAGGVYYLTELLHGPDPDGDYGIYAYGLSGAGSLLETIEDGGDVVAIHGTDDPDVVGTDVSSGCFHLENEVIQRMADDIGLPLGTPVEIRA